MIVARILAFAAGAAVAVSVLGSAIRTVVIPRGEHTRLTSTVFVSSRQLFELLARRHRDNRVAKERLLAGYAPFSLFGLVATWMTLVLLAFVPMYWAVGVDFPGDALLASGSAMFTLGAVFRADGGYAALTFVEAALGLGLLALLISFLPTMYSQFSRREAMVALLETRAGSPPTPAEWLRRANFIGWLEDMDDQWAEWERWFIDLEEAHTSYPALNYFRSPQPDRSWITAAGAVLDTAAMYVSSVDAGQTVQANLFIRTGYLSLRRIADYYRISYDRAPAAGDPIAVTRDEFDAEYRSLVDGGVPVHRDVDACWPAAFAGWRVNYDQVLLGLCTLVDPPPQPWSADKAGAYHRPPVPRLVTRRRD